MKLTSEYTGIQRDRHGWEHTRWECKLKVGKRVVRFPYRMGMAHTREPDAIEAAAALVWDADAGALSFEAFCADHGDGAFSSPVAAYDMWRDCKASARKVSWLWPNGVPARLRKKFEAL